MDEETAVTDIKACGFSWIDYLKYDGNVAYTAYVIAAVNASV